MKELSIEEKAKAYDEAIEKLRRLHDDYDTVSTLIDIKEELEHIFPEFKETKDERISKELIQFLRDYHFDKLQNKVDIDTLELWAAWLEKQGGQKPKRMVSAEAKEAMYDKPAWSEDDEVKINRIVACLENLNVADNDILLKDIDWLKSLKGIVQPQKQEWSEKDKCMLNNVIDTLKPLSQTTHSGYAINSMIDWLKSLKERYTWKPSDLPHWKKSNLPNNTTTGFNSDYFCHKGYCINYEELFEKLPKDD